MIDEYDGRGVAVELGIGIKGVLGLLIDAKLAGHVPAVRPLVDRLVTEIDFHVSPGIRRQILARAGESD